MILTVYQGHISLLFEKNPSYPLQPGTSSPNKRFRQPNLIYEWEWRIECSPLFSNPLHLKIFVSDPLLLDRILNYDPEAPHWMNRDRFVLSMGARGTKKTGRKISHPPEDLVMYMKDGREMISLEKNAQKTWKEMAIAWPNMIMSY